MTLRELITARTLVARRRRRAIKLMLIHFGVIFMGLDGAVAWGIAPLAAHVAHICGATGATVAGIACYFEE